MQREVDSAIDQRLLDFLHEQALTPDLRERPIAHRVTGGCNDHDFDGALGSQFGMRGAQSSAQLLGLGQGKLGAPGANADQSRAFVLVIHGLPV